MTAQQDRTAPTGAEPAARLNARQVKAIAAGAVGNTIEWVDWALYAIFAKIISTEFFPSGADDVALLSTLAIFAVGFVMRPVGAAALGVYADRNGRKKGLTLTVGLMAGASFVIALTPSYGSIGVAAPSCSCWPGWSRGSPPEASSGPPRRSWSNPGSGAAARSPAPGSRCPSAAAH